VSACAQTQRNFTPAYTARVCICRFCGNKTLRGSRVWGCALRTRVSIRALLVSRSVLRGSSYILGSRIKHIPFYRTFFVLYQLSPPLSLSLSLSRHIRCALSSVLPSLAFRLIISNHLSIVHVESLFRLISESVDRFRELVRTRA